MLIKIIDNQWMYFEQITDGEEKIIDKEFQVEDPRAQYIEAGLFGGVWHKYNRAKKRLALPFFNDLIKLCDKRMIPYMVSDMRGEFSLPDISRVVADMIPGICLL